MAVCIHFQILIYSYNHFIRAFIIIYIHCHFNISIHLFLSCYLFISKHDFKTFNHFHMIHNANMFIHFIMFIPIILSFYVLIFIWSDLWREAVTLNRNGYHVKVTGHLTCETSMSQSTHCHYYFDTLLLLWNSIIF